MPDSPEIRAVSSEVVYRNRWMAVREDKIVRADGSPGIYGVVEKKDFVIVAAIEDGRVWLVEQYRYPVGRRYWELPQGAHEDRATEPLELAAAELREETGLRAGRIVGAGRLFAAYGFATQAFEVCLATELVEGECERDAEELGMEARSFALSELEGMIAEGAIMDAGTVAAFGLLRLKGMI